MPLAVQEEARLIAVYEKLPPASRKEVFDFADSLAHRTGGKQKFPRTSVEQVAGFLPYHGTAKTIREMNEAIANGISEQWKK